MKTSDQCHTPPELFKLCQDRWGPFTIDVAANPPYSRGEVIKWVRKAPSAKRCVMLLKSDFTPDWARELWQTADEIVLLQSRVAFGGPGALVRGRRQGAAFSSMVVVWGCGGRVHGDSGTAPHVWAWDWKADL